MIFLQILKVIGFILLVIVWVFLIAILLALFVPVRYKIRALYDKEHELDVSGNISFLLRMINLTFQYKEEFNWTLRLFGRIFRSSKLLAINKKAACKPEEGKEKKTVTPKTKSPKEEKKSPEEPIKNDTKGEKQSGGDKGKKEEKNDSHKKDSDLKEEASENGKAKKAKSTKKGRKKSKKEDKKSQIIDLLKAPETSETVGLVLSLTGRLIRHILPRKLEGRIGFGVGDEYTEGKILGYLSLLYPVYAGRFTLEPYWDEERLELDIYAAGRLRLVFVLIMILKLFFNKKVRATVDRIMKVF